MKAVESATYLGGTLTRDVNPLIEIRTRISATLPVVKKLELFWKNANCHSKLKFTVYNAVITTKLIYGLENLKFTEALGHVLGTFQLRGLRKILGIPPTYTWVDE